MTQRFDRVHSRGPRGGIDAEEEADRCGDTECQQCDVPTEHRLHVLTGDVSAVGEAHEDGSKRDADASTRDAVTGEAGGGGVFVLFTSYSHLRRVRDHLEPFLREKNLLCLAQGDGLSRDRMLSRFREDGRAVLLGADSFWEGVDVPGRALSSVIIVKLPFAVPTRPLVEARVEEERKRGRDPFKTVTLPETALRLRQGFGRLIRSHRDKGVVAILDPRIRSRRYGAALLDALPPCPVLEDWPEPPEEGD